MKPVIKREKRRAAKRAADAALGAKWPKLQSGLDLESPSFQKRLRNVLGVLVLSRPFTQTGGTNVLVRLELELLYDLLKLSNSGHYRTDRFRLAPVRIAASLCHRLFSSYLSSRIQFTDDIRGPEAPTNSMYLIGFTTLQQRFRAPFQVFSPGPTNKREGANECYTIPRLSPRFKQNFQLPSAV